VWVSPVDAGLYFSVLLRPKIELGKWPLITLMTALVVSDAVRETCSLETDIKWPNDVQADGRKICGILAEAVSTPFGRAAIVGVGINVKRGALPPELGRTASSIEELTGASPVTEELLRALTRGLGQRYEELHEPNGPALLVDEWMTRSSYASGLRVRVAFGDEDAIEGVTRGLTSDGALRVETDDSQIRVVHAGDVTAVRVAEQRNSNQL
jgi:BirA family biotin operon repressor/biotin-[acetyl-CoA-carboxylase] ligase